MMCQSLKRGSHKDWRPVINGQSLKKGSYKDWRAKINGQSLKSTSHKDWKPEIDGQSLKRGSGKDWGRMFRVVERREPIQKVDGLGLWDVEDVSLRRSWSGTCG